MSVKIYINEIPQKNWNKMYDVKSDNFVFVQVTSNIVLKRVIEVETKEDAETIAENIALFSNHVVQSILGLMKTEKPTVSTVVKNISAEEYCHVIDIIGRDMVIEIICHYIDYLDVYPKKYF